MLDFNKDETELKTMTAHVILSFDNVIHERNAVRRSSKATSPSCTKATQSASKEKQTS